MRSPIVVFCSHGDDITPPQQALNWIALGVTLVFFVIPRVSPFDGVNSFLNDFNVFRRFSEWLVAKTEDLFREYGYYVVFFGVLAENSMFLGLFVPGAIILILAMATAMTNYVIQARIPQSILEFFIAQGMNATWQFILVLNLFVFVLAMLMEPFGALLVAVPLLIPLAATFGLNPFHLAVMFLLNLEIAYVTPPIVMVRPSPAPASPFEASRSIGPQPFDSLSQVRSETKTSPVGAAACAGTAAITERPVPISAPVTKVAVIADVRRRVRRCTWSPLTCGPRSGAARATG